MKRLSPGSEEPNSKRPCNTFTTSSRQVQNRFGAKSEPLFSANEIPSFFNSVTSVFNSNPWTSPSHPPHSPRSNPTTIDLCDDDVKILSVLEKPITDLTYSPIQIEEDLDFIELPDSPIIIVQDEPDETSIVNVLPKIIPAVAKLFSPTSVFQKSLNFFWGQKDSPKTGQEKLPAESPRKQATLSSWLGVLSQPKPPPTPPTPPPAETKKKKNAFWNHKPKVVPKCPFYKTVPKTNFIIDGFNSIYTSPANPIFFLTHFHSDHYGGLTKAFDRGPIYCTDITANLVVLKLGVSKKYLHTIPLRTPTKVGNMIVEYFDANHCPGSVLILFSSCDDQPVVHHLHTGDFRFDPNVEDHRIVASYPISNLYLDTTYCDPKHQFPAQAHVISFTLDSIGEDIKRPDTIIAVGAYTIGKERLFIEAAKRFNVKIHVDSAKFKIIANLNYPPEILNLFTTSLIKAKIHVVAMNAFSYDKLGEYVGKIGWPVSRVVAVKPTGWTFNGDVNSVPKRRTNKEGNISVIEVPYSEHSSFNELHSFVQLLKVKWIIPTVNQHKVEEVKRMLSLLSSPITPQKITNQKQRPNTKNVSVFFK